jgi:hypothetical protein
MIVALMLLREEQCAFPFLRHSADPTLRSYLVKRIGLARVPTRIFQDSLSDGGLDADTRQALILALGNYPRGAIAPDQRSGLVRRLHEIMTSDADAGVHAAAQWVLASWDIALPTRQSGRPDSPGHRNWYVTSHGQTMVVLDYPADSLALSAQPPPRGHRFAIAAKEVTVEQFAQFLPDHRIDWRSSHEDTCPANTMTWYEAAAYCNWLSEKEGLPETQWCYHPNEHGEYAEGMTIAPDCLRRRGYRLPLAAEWLYAASAGATSQFFFGSDSGLMTDYGWMARNSQGLHHPVGTLQPNLFGLFDIYGNVKEWTHSLEETRPDDVRVTNADKRCVLGAGYQHFDHHAGRNYAKHGNPPALRENHNGFRIARTLCAMPAG